jgi:prepilin-type N-terminal cleavage/methylation domain-containing protein
MNRTAERRGFTLAEMMVVISIIGILASMTTVALLNMVRRAALRGAAQRVECILRRVQYDAYGMDRYRGVKFTKTAKGWRYAVYEDGNGNGVHNADIASGVDRLVEGPYDLSPTDSLAHVAAPSDLVTDPDTNLPFSGASAAVEFNNSTICSFAPNGDGTPGSIFLGDGDPHHAATVRSSGAGGKIRIRYFEGGSWYD